VTVRDASISACGTYRYWLSRWWGDGFRVATFVMLNPSTADAHADDPTIRRCIGFAKRLGANALRVVNLYALRSPDPDDIFEDPDPVGPRNDNTIYAERLSDWVIAAWGAHSAATPGRVARVRELLAGREVHCLGRTKSGAPRHPLYLPADAPLETFWPSLEAA
jgi:hypothetical protein